MPTKIEWTDHTWNPVTGCTNISPGCDNCYAETITNRFKRHPWNEVTLHPDRIKVDPSWKPGQRIFLCSMGDLFHSAVPWEFIARVFALMQAHQELTFQVLTKRPGRMMYFANVLWPGWSHTRYPDGLVYPPLKRWPTNVWAGTSVENQKYAARLDLLLQVPAPIRFVSYEPALEAVDFRPWLYWKDLDSMPTHYRVEGFQHPYAKSNGINWFIAGGESGAAARPAHPDWFGLARDQCQEAGVPFFFKQWGESIDYDNMDAGLRQEWAGKSNRRFVSLDSGLGGEGNRFMYRVGKKAAGALLGGREWREFPKAVAARPRVIKRRRTGGWRMPEGAVYVGRPTIYGNPFRTAAEFRHWWETRGKGRVLYPDRMDMLMGAMFQTEPHPLRGRDLVCWCVDWDGTGEAPGACHAEVLLEIANGGDR